MDIVSSLVQGFETEENIIMLIGFTDMDSEKMQGALISHYANGASSKIACSLNGVTAGNFSRDKKRIEGVARQIDNYNENAHKHLSAQLKAMKAELIELKGVDNG